MSEDSVDRVEPKGMGYEKISKDGEITVEEGEVRLRRVSGEDLIIEGSVTVSAGDEIYWMADCVYTRRLSA